MASGDHEEKHAFAANAMFIFLVSSDDVSFELQRWEGDTAGRMGCTNMYRVRGSGKKFK